MDFDKALSKAFSAAEILYIDDFSKIVLMSDCHRGDGSWADDFARNANAFYAAAEHYCEEGFTYIEIGDGDELWENRSMRPVSEAHREVFKLLSEMNREGRYYMIYGNHDIVKRREPMLRRAMCTARGCEPALFKNLAVHEAIVLQHAETGREALVIHGHQADPLNSRYWRLARALVRYLWGPLENFGVKDPTRAARNFSRRNAVERRLMQWAKKHSKAVFAGHTHRPVFPREGEAPYFNDGSCVHPYCITAIEIEGGQVTLVRWCVRAAEDGYLRVKRETMAGPEKLSKFF